MQQISQSTTDSIHSLPLLHKMSDHLCNGHPTPRIARQDETPSLFQNTLTISVIGSTTYVKSRLPLQPTNFQRYFVHLGSLTDHFILDYAF